MRLCLTDQEAEPPNRKELDGKAEPFRTVRRQSRKRKAQNSEPETHPLRLDLFLKASRLCSRRTLAQKLCDAGRVSINGHTAKPSHAVKVGDEITVRRQQKLTTVRVLSVPTARQTSRKDAGALYEILREEIQNEVDL